MARISWERVAAVAGVAFVAQLRADWLGGLLVQQAGTSERGGVA